MGENTELRRSITNGNKIMYKFNDKKLKVSKIQIQTKAKPLEALGCTSTQSPNLVSNGSYFPQVGLCEAPGSDVPVRL